MITLENLWPGKKKSTFSFGTKTHSSSNNNNLKKVKKEQCYFYKNKRHECVGFLLIPFVQVKLLWGGKCGWSKAARNKNVIGVIE